MDEQRPLDVGEIVVMHSYYTGDDSLVNYRGRTGQDACVVFDNGIQLMVPYRWLRRQETETMDEQLTSIDYLFDEDEDFEPRYPLVQRNLPRIRSAYAAACRAFALETMDWGGLDSSRFYTTDGAMGWRDTCDNAHGGIDVAWAFHLTVEEIEERAYTELLDLIWTVRVREEDRP